MGYEGFLERNEILVRCPDTMRVSLLLAHPKPGSFNHAIAETAMQGLQHNGHQVAFHDLYLEGFDPVLPWQEIPKGAPVDPLIQRHCHEIASAEGIIIVHPNWWGQPPAILKGWVDRVIRPGVAYQFLEGDSGKGVPCGLLVASTAVVFNTSNTDADREKMVFGDPLETIWKNHIRFTGKCILSSLRERIVCFENRCNEKIHIVKGSLRSREI